MSEDLKNMDETVEGGSVEIKQELRDDIQSMIENIEEEYDDEIVIDDDDVSDFLNEHSSSSNEISSAEVVPKSEPVEVPDFNEYEHTEDDTGDLFDSVSSEINQEIKSEKQDEVGGSIGSSEEQALQYPNQSTQQYQLQPTNPYPPPSSEAPEYQQQYDAQQDGSFTNIDSDNSHAQQYEQLSSLSSDQQYQQHVQQSAGEFSLHSYAGSTNQHDHQQPSHPPQVSEDHQQEYSHQSYDSYSQYPYQGEYYTGGAVIKDEYIEDEWKKQIKEENVSENQYDQNYLAGNLGFHAQKKQKVGTDGWVADSTVPSGWKYKVSLGNNKTMVSSPGGQKFDSRKNALKFMKANNFPQEEIAFMDECLQYEGWKVDEFLPEGWKFRPGKNSGTEYMTSEEGIFNSTYGATREIQSNYPPAVFERFQLFTQKHGKKTRPPSYFVPQQQVRPPPPQNQPPPPAQRPEWVADQSIPIGWRIWKGQGKEMILSPNGIQFGSRREAFQELVAKNYPDTMKAEMFDKLSYEGFQANDYLPFGWIYKKTVEGELNFLTREGRLLTSFNEAFEFFRTSWGVSQEDVQKFESFERMTGTGSMKPIVWNENDQTVPIGWKTRPAENGRQNQKLFLSPDGYELKSRRLALKHMIQYGFSQESVEEMRRFLYYEGWMDDQSLPYLWKMKRTGNTLLFVSGEGEVLESNRGAIDFIQKNPHSYNKEDIERIEYVWSMAMKTIRPTKPTVVPNTRKSINQLPSQISVRKVDSSYVEDGSVPKGWKIKTDGSRVSLMAPNGTTYISRRTAYQAMIQERYPNEEIDAMRRTLKYDGWLDNSELPDGWKIKQMPNNVYLIDRGGELFKSYIEAAKFIETYFQYFSQEDMDKINRLARINQPPKVNQPSKNFSGWDANDPTIPRGWKSKGRCGKGKILMSPEGTVYNSRTRA